VIYGSVCSGIECPSVAWHPLGWKPAFFSEIDPFPSAVLAHHYPHVPNLGDMTRFHEWPDAAIDLLVGGTPCQAFSVAGLRKGLDDPRGNLTLVYLAIAERYRPRWLVWENVPGVLSIDNGRTFGAFLGGLAKLGYGFAYRVLDAQFFGVPQRRRRVFVVGCLGDWRAAAAVLFERESLRRDLAPRRKAGERVAGTVTSRFGNGSRQAGANGNLIARCVTTGEGRRQDGETRTLIAHSLRADGFDASEDGTGRGTPLVPVAFNWQSGGDCRGLEPRSVTMALSREQTPAIAFSSKDHGLDAGTISPTLRAGVHSGSHANAGVPPAVAFAGNVRHELREMAVRRLTPRECERLQGFPDDWTAITYRNKPAADGPRYRALGNSMAVPVMRWIGERIEMVEAILKTRAA
jgi:DNA (cytosine-5)-methyltransferase 1